MIDTQKTGAKLEMPRKPKAYRLLLAICLFAASTAIAADGPMAEYRLHCGWSPTDSEADCADLVGRLEAQGAMDREHRLALVRSRRSLASRRGTPQPKAEVCAGVGSIVRDHPGYAEALRDLSFCTDDWGEATALLRRALESDPDNYSALSSLVIMADGIAGGEARDLGIDSATMARHREALYESAKRRVAWNAKAAPQNTGSRLVWQELFVAARYLHAEAIRQGDRGAAEAIQARVRADAGLDALQFGREEPCPDPWDDCRRGSRGDSLAMACNPILIAGLGMEDMCLAAVEDLAGRASSAGLPLPADVLATIESVTDRLREKSCDGDGSAGLHLRVGVQCQGWRATETPTVAALRHVLESHQGPLASEHLRVYAQGFLGDSERLEGLRAAIQANPENTTARCDLARALAAREMPEEGVEALGDGDSECFDDPSRTGFTWGDLDDYLAAQERFWQKNSEEAPRTAL